MSSSHEKILMLAMSANLSLRPEQVDDLVDAYGHVETMLSRMKEHLIHLGEPAHVFHPLAISAKES